MKSLKNKFVFMSLATILVVMSLIEYFGSSEKDSGKTTAVEQISSESVVKQSDRERIRSEVLGEFNQADLDILENGTPEDKDFMNELINAEVEDRLNGKKTRKMKILSKEESDALQKELFGEPKPFSETKWGAEKSN